MAGNKPHLLESKTLTDPDFYRSFNLESFQFSINALCTVFKVLTGATNHQETRVAISRPVYLSGD